MQRWLLSARAGAAKASARTDAVKRKDFIEYLEVEKAPWSTAPILLNNGI
jgi:hypothetical protein